MAYDNDREKRNAYMREYRARRTSDTLGLRPRGRKPLDLKLLGVWEFEWYKALHLLRDGTQLPPDPNAVVVNERMAKDELSWWKKASLKDILGGMEPGPPPPFNELAELERDKAKERWTMHEWKLLKDRAEQERESTIAGLGRWLKPKETPTRLERREIWVTLVESEASTKTIEQACERWKRLVDVRAHGMTVFADHVLANLEEFRRMKDDKRYPGPDADDSRLDYLARGMAGIMLDASPFTAIHRLRLMKHQHGGPLWLEEESWVDTNGKRNKVTAHCGCWRCRLQASRRYWGRLKTLQEGL